MTVTDLPVERAPEPPPAPAATRHECPYCDYSGPLTMNVRRHIQVRHPEHWEPGPPERKRTRSRAKTERAPKPPRPKVEVVARAPARVSLAEDITEIAGGLADALAFAGAYPATAAALAYCAPALGQAADGAIAGTRVDKGLQRLANRKGRMRGLGDVAFLLAAVAAVERAPVLREPLKARVRGPMKRIAIQGAAIRRRQLEQEKKAIAAFAELAEYLDGDLARSEDPAGELFDSFFPPVEEVEDGPPAE